MTHTPGPWRECRGSSDRGCLCGLVWSAAADIPVASCDLREELIPDHFAPLAERQANARVIAAAPDLLEALQRLMSLMHHDSLGEAPNDYDWGDAANESAKAIAKARGES